ncbi:glutathione S-transferase family protein [Psychrobacter sp. FDAARGOS_221]|uniref:glutathione S-transferase family protein n=1 Tax=Psychrobacter sp. FDAARGOS_221 TaxID=1975705 RepID=UPI000BB58376|nr:glutathione S-transferase family protein [Psychrobacter sp. FDAARGOS_221]PNK60903.1 glutathione S-transferase family protein [Psychrobacter sp. FDAARGOS_221]
MTHPLLIIGNKNYSSWSLRAWLLLKAFNIYFKEQKIELFQPSSKPILDKYSASGKVPILVDYQGDTQSSINITDSLAIALYANDYLTDLDIWSGRAKSEVSLIQSDTSSIQEQRAFCQSIVTEMHSGFMGLRQVMAVNIRATARITPTPACLKDLQRIEAIFETCLNSDAHKNSANNYLFGDFSIADAWYAPVVFRLKSYANASNIQLKTTTYQYCEIILSHPHLKQWHEDALQETTMLPEDETGEILSVEGVLAD